MIKGIIQSTVFLFVTLALCAYVAMELEEFNSMVAKQLVVSYQVKQMREIAQDGF